MKLPRFINTVVEELDKLGQIHRQLRIDGFCELTDMYQKRAEEAYALAAKTSNKEEARRLMQAGDLAMLSMSRSADAIGLNLNEYGILMR